MHTHKQHSCHTRSGQTGHDPVLCALGAAEWAPSMNQKVGVQRQGTQSLRVETVSPLANLAMSKGATRAREVVALTAVRLSVGVSSSSEFSNFRLSEVEVARLWEACCCWLALRARAPYARNVIGAAKCQLWRRDEA